MVVVVVVVVVMVIVVMVVIVEEEEEGVWHSLYPPLCMLWLPRDTLPPPSTETSIIGHDDNVGGAA